MRSGNRFLTRAGLELAYFSGYARFMRTRAGGAGVVLRFERVRPRRWTRFQPLRSGEITPQFLDKALRAIKRWDFDIVSMDEVCHRSVRLAAPKRFVCLTFDGAYKDLMTSAYPVLSRHRVPFTVYVPTAFPDGLGEAWRLGLAEAIAREPRISLVIDRKERHFGVGTASEKYELYEYLEGWMRSLAPPDLSLAIKDLCRRYSVDLAKLSREVSMSWEDLAKLAADPLVTIGSATVNYPILSNLKNADALREIKMGKAVAEAALHREVKHFAYPSGERDSFGRRHMAMVAEAGLTSAVSAIPAVVGTAGSTDLYAIPRIAWDGRRRSLRILRMVISGIASPAVQPVQSEKF